MLPNSILTCKNSKKHHLFCNNMEIFCTQGVAYFFYKLLCNKIFCIFAAESPLGGIY